MRFRLRTLLIIAIPTAISGYLGFVLLTRHFLGPAAQFGNGMNIGTILGAMLGLSIGMLLASQHVSASIAVPTQGLKIAYIALANDALLLTGNLRDFEQVPELQVENWL